MSVILVTLAAAVVAVGLFVLGLSITRLRKGHDLESDVGSNRHMQRLGIECASAQIRREEAARKRQGTAVSDRCDPSCSRCGMAERCGGSE